MPNYKEKNRNKNDDGYIFAMGSHKMGASRKNLNGQRNTCTHTSTKCIPFYVTMTE